MRIKALITSCLLATTLLTTMPIQKANAGIVVGAAGMITGMALLPLGGGANAEYGLIVGSTVCPVGIVTIITGSIFMFFNPTPGMVLIILGEDGKLPQNDLESALAEKYSFIQDPLVTSDLASMIKAKAENQVADKDGKILVNLTQEEIEKALEHTDLMETQSSLVQSMMKDLM